MPLDEGAELAPGRTVVEHVRSGKRYDVYLVWDERMYALVVAKALRRDRIESERARQRLRDEVELLARLAHPAIVRSFGAVLDGPSPHVLLEYVEAPNLRRLVRRHGALPPEQLVPLGFQTASALHYLAGEEVVHLDVKPSNVLLSAPPRLIDFGGARALDVVPRLRRPVGTALYMAPELCSVPETAARVGPAADVWGLGATLFYGLAGRPPFARVDDARASDDRRIRYPQLASDPAPVGVRVPAELERVVLAMLERDPAARPTAAEVADSLGALLD